MHYHVFMGASSAAPMATTTIEDYDESIRKFLKLTKKIYGEHPYFNKGLDYKNLLTISNFGEGPPMTLGVQGLCVQWFPCPGQCISPSWN